MVCSFHNSTRNLRKLTFELLMNVGVSETIVALKTGNQDLRNRNKYRISGLGKLENTIVPNVNSWKPIKMGIRLCEVT